MSEPVRRLARATVARRVAALLDRGRVRVDADANVDAGWSDAGDVTIDALPRWVRSAGLAASGGQRWLWISPRAGTRGDIASAQAVLGAPRGRYRVDTIDTESGDIVAREVASAPPLVIGLPRRASAVLVRIERIA
jgi:hypothetical protein